MNRERSLSWPAKIAFGAGDFGFNLYYTGLSLFLLYYYTDVLDIRPAIAGLIFALPLFWDAVTDPVMGSIASRTRTRWGSYRPYLLLGSVPLALSFVAMFAAPLLMPGAVIAAAAVSHVVFRTCYTVVSIPYGALSARITQDSTDRGDLAGARMIFATLGGLFVVLVTLPLAAQFGTDMRTGFALTACLYSVIATAILVLTFALVREPSKVELAPADWRAVRRALSRNRALWVLVTAIVFGATSGAVFSKALIYYVQYVAGINLSITAALIALTAATSLSVPVWMLISRRVAKRTAWLTGAGITLTMQAVLFAAPPQTPATFLALLIALGLGNGAFYVTFWSMLPDTVEYGEWRSGVRDEGLVFGLNQLALKAAAGVGIGLLGFLLDAVGYQANVPQSDGTVAGLRVITTVLPFVLTLLAAITIAFYPVDRRLHARLVRALSQRTRTDAGAGAKA